MLYTPPVMCILYITGDVFKRLYTSPGDRSPQRIDLFVDGVTVPATKVTELIEVYWKPRENEALSCRGLN